jgi:hypothetical protein
MPCWGAESEMLLDVRIYRLHAGKRNDFDSLVRNQTIPLARRFGHQVVDFGPSAHDDDTYYLIRVFDSGADRQQSLASLYESEEWLRDYDDKVMALIDSYQTAVFATSLEAVHYLRAAHTARWKVAE